jgi:dsDNA-specific endonuclease/ATPase MutS2
VASNALAGLSASRLQEIQQEPRSKRAIEFRAGAEPLDSSQLISHGRRPHHGVMPFPTGSAVAVVSLRRHGHVLEVLSGGRYRVAVGGLTMVCEEAQLATVSHSKRQQRREREAPTRHAEAAAPPPSTAATGFRSIDLHGMTMPEALVALPVFLDHAIRAGLPHVEIIHGISGGRLRAAVRDYLAGVPAVVCVAPDERNPGVTIAYF